ncbi:MAG: galactokinase, partial [Caldibacillus sp.]
YIPLHLDDYRIIIMNTNKRRELADSKYNERRSQCEKALRILQQHIDIKYLCDLSKDQLDQLKQHLTDGTIYKRAKHVVSENERTLAAAEAVKQGDLTRFGQYLNESHISLRDDYEVTGKELDTIVSAAWEQEGVLGARMTGAGFGGCAIAIVEEDQVDSFIKNVSAIYKEKIGYDASFYNVTLGDGVKEIENFSL